MKKSCSNCLQRTWCNQRKEDNKYLRKKYRASQYSCQGWIQISPKLCVFCNHNIKSMKDPTITRQDSMSFQFMDKWICGTCGDGLKNNE